MFENTHWFWFLIGCVPYTIERKLVRRGWQLHVRALFWTLTMTRRHYKRKRRRWTRTHWRLRVPLIIKLRQAVWAAVLSLRN